MEIAIYQMNAIMKVLNIVKNQLTIKVKNVIVFLNIIVIKIVV